MVTFQNDRMMRLPDISICPRKLLVVEIYLTVPIRKYQHNQVFLGFKVFNGFEYEIIIVGERSVGEIPAQVEVGILFEGDSLVLRQPTERPQ